VKKFMFILLMGVALGYAQGGLPPLLANEAEAQYAYGLSLAFQGQKEAGFLVLAQLAENGYHNPYAFQMILSLGTSLLQQRSFSLIEAEKVPSLVNYLADMAYSNYSTNREVLYGYLDVKKTLGQWKDFEIALKQLVVLDPENILGNFYRGLLFYQQGRFDEARIFLRKVTQLEGTDDSSRQAVYQSYYILGLIELQEENYRGGVAILEKARSLADKDYNLDKYLAYGYQQILEFQKAYNLVSNIPEIFYGNDLAVLRIQTAFILGKPEWERFARAYEKSSPLARVYVLYAQKKYRDVLTNLESLMREYEIEPVRLFYPNYLRLKSAEALRDQQTKRQMLFLLGLYAYQVGKTSMAIEYLLPLEKEADLRPEALLTLASLYEEVDQVGEAILRYESFLKEKNLSTPTEKVFEVNLALAYLYGRTTNVYRSELYRKEAEKLAKTPSQQYRYWFYTGLLNYQKQWYKEALASFQKAQSISNTASVNYYIGNTFFLLQQLGDAQRYLEQALELGEGPEVYNLLAYVYALQKKLLDKALSYVRRALEQDPENIAYQDTLGWVYYQQGDYEKALEVFASILVRLDGMDFEGMDEIYYHAGMVYDALGRSSEARALWEKGLVINPKNGYIKERLLSR